MLFGIDGNVLQLEEGQGLFHNSSAGAPAAAIFRTLGGVVSVSMDKKTLNYNTSTTILSLNIEKTPTLAGEIARLLIKVADVAMVLELSFPERDEIIEAIWNDENPHITLDNLQTLENILTGLEKRRVGSPYILLHNALILNSGNASTNGTGSLAIDKLIFSYLARAIFNWSKQRITATLRFAGARFSLEVNKDDNDPNGVKLTITDQSKNQSRDFSFTDSPTKFAELFEQAMLDE
ncbi:hypothetical protein A2291_08505 [candidate division WOR-1 bacterium RIFOXYB2_FULL_42_35]|uniref:Uncharacterized protein n=1 Tax=candidate division WOR-1 bacterium RIFOXYC2_FULL_41_25 TaxID=1802586 RepID=A0A1F4TMM0_UNCSA|nr:MAG: hypothetical protein A2247_05200 [candidate division WOR-1 bacterium RIFOXYA2_FULL_41_14]OGC23885.1 MAG: hypothetical protein A2291_08505 [candidate division WOR-1 bacterium RIFOXYB2_FULL_42_35]OGC33760.1 MAG: hypothetical protein A2462_00595 [candidate division WOR-1 bacterium RIFOXYC2_FULL_41_25]OGC44181.1 MAG: hypothetical protein A2548_02965 [candidate division WOR-1 bacterium RIFOXYD2_FULL_41_8]